MFDALVFNSVDLGRKNLQLQPRSQVVNRSRPSTHASVHDQLHGQFNRHADVKTTDLYQKLNFSTGLQNYEQISKL